MCVSTPTLQRLEAGDPGVSLGILATALFLIPMRKAQAESAS